MQSRAPAARSTISFAKNFKQLPLRINRETASIRVTVRVRVITHNVDANGLAGYMVSGCCAVDKWRNLYLTIRHSLRKLTQIAGKRRR